MATGNNKEKNLLALTDCLYFTNGSCMFKGKCHYRHCKAASEQLEKCSKWPDSCRNVVCPYRHIGTASKIPKCLPQEKGLVIFFWDIENVPIPKGQKPFDIVQRVRQKLVVERGLQEVDFSCYCNSNTISQENQQSLHHATVRMIHVPDRKPGAADRQIMLDLDRFERAHRPPATIVLISGDIDFVGKLSDLRHQAKFHVIVIHNKPAKEELKVTVNEHYPWELFTGPSQQQQPMMQPVTRNNSEKLTDQPARARPVLNNRLNNDDNVHRTATPTLIPPPLMSVSTLRGENNLPQNDPLQTNSRTATPTLIPPPLMSVSALRGENNLRQNDPLQTNSATTLRPPGSATRKDGPSSRNQPLKPTVTQPVNQTEASNAGTNTPPSVPKPIIAPRARIRHASSTDELDRQNISSGPAREPIIPSTIIDDIEKIQPNPLPCPYCTNEFTTIKALRQHQKDKKHLFDCPVCKEGFPTSSGLKQHQIAKEHNTTNNVNNVLNNED